jgi:hypothetical protein
MSIYSSRCANVVQNACCIYLGMAHFNHLLSRIF